MLTLRKAVVSDVHVLKGMIDQMGEYEHLPVAITEECLQADGFGEIPQFHALIAEWLSHPVGYVLFHRCYSSFQGKGIFLEDIFVEPRSRGKGIARALLAAVAAVAVQEDCFGIVFNVLAWNIAALDFFEKLGASVSTDWKTLTLTGIALEAAIRQ